MLSGCYRTIVSTLVTCGLLVSDVGLLWAQQPTPSASDRQRLARLKMVDVALAPGGIMRGQVVDGQGQPLAAHDVFLKPLRGKVLKTKTDTRGFFSVDGLRGGVVQVAAGGTLSVARSWAPKTAPPAANDTLLVVAKDSVERGQRPIGDLFFADPILVAVIVGAAIAVPIAVHDSRDGS